MMEKEECQGKKIKFAGNEESNVKDEERCNASAVTTSIATLNTLIFWNISKAVEKKPSIDLKSAINAAQMRLERESHDVNTMMSDDPEERYLGCAVLAWQQLGNLNADSLYQFIEAKRRETSASEKQALKDVKPINSCSKTLDAYPALSSSHASKPEEVTTKRSYLDASNDSTSFDSYSLIGPVVKLPVESKIVMRLENTCRSCSYKNKESKSPTNCPQVNKSQSQEKDVMEKIDAACCMDSECVERLQELDASIAELRVRAGRLARREAERAELLERAETAWKDLDLGYQRRLTLAIEKEDDIAKQVQKMIEERNSFKDICTKLAQTLKEKSTLAEADRARLVKEEKELCQKACKRQKLIEECARIDATIAEHQCKAAQLDRDLQFKEEQARRRLASMKSEVEAAHALTHEVERALRAELGALREQVAQVSNELLEQDALNGQMQLELEQLQQQKNGMEEDLEACKTMCDGRIQDKLDELKKKRDQLAEFREKVTECRCKMPVDENVQVKRTPSLAALCRCPPDEEIPASRGFLNYIYLITCKRLELKQESCSCTSLRSRLLSNLLSDLFRGLQGELGETDTQMPCQLLKCLDDKHNWDRSSEIKINLRNFFSQLLMGELDIAITTSIENYHAKWIGALCADTKKRVISDARGCDGGSIDAENWQEREYECRAQKLVTQFAEQLFQDRTRLQTHRTNTQIIDSRNLPSPKHPLCECCQPESAVYQCLVKAPKLGSGISKKSSTTASKYWQRTFQDVTELKQRLEDLKKETVKKEDLRKMEDNITKIVQQVSVPATINKASDIKPTKHVEDHRKNEDKKLLNTKVCINNNKLSNNITKKQINFKSHLNKSNKNTFYQNEPIVESRKHKKIGQSIAVNLCLCTHENDSMKQKPLANTTNINSKQKKSNVNNSTNLYYEQHNAPLIPLKPLKLMVSHMSSVRQTKPISPMVSNGDNFDKAKISTQKCVCFHKTPSRSSIDNLLDNLINLKVVEKNQHNRETVTDMKTVVENKDYKISKQVSTNSDKEIGTLTSLFNLNQKSAKYSGEAPEPTESEYIGAINLDKSFENECNRKNESEHPDTRHSNTTFMCVHSALSGCKDLVDLNNKKVEIKKSFDKKDLQSHSLQCDIKRTVMSSLSPCACDYNINFLGVTLTNLNLEQTSEKDCDISKSNFSNMLNAKKKSNNRLHPDKVCDTQNTIDIHNLIPCYVKPILSTSKKVLQTVNADKPLDTLKTRDYDDVSPRVHSPFNITKEHNKTVSNNILLHDIDYDDLPSCERSPKLSSSKEVNNTIFLDKAADNEIFTPSLLKTQESCVCCKSPSKDEAKQLEINAFHLLKEHLKRKLMETKTFDKSSSQDVVQNKILADVLQKTNQVISDNLNVIACKCSEENKSEGSWDRAYSLLQEYLKVKINRVQCICTPNTETANTVLPSILHKVCSLINNDFQRVESLCVQNNCFKTKKLKKEQLADKKIPEKDTNITSKHVRISVGTENISDKKIEENMYKPLFVCQNVSLQVPSYLRLESKSCDAIPKGSQCIQTEIMCNNYNKSNSMTSVLNGRFTNTKECNSTKILPYIGNTIDCTCDRKVGACICMKSVIEGHQVEIDNIWKNLTSQKNSLKNMSYIMSKVNPVSIEHIPSYIGHTLNCMCDGNIGNCICMKSVVEANPTKIENIWKEFTGRQLTHGNVSYIMSSVNREPENLSLIEAEENINNIFKTDVTECIDKNICEAQINVNDGEEIFLKKSIINVVKAHNSTNTSDYEDAVGLNPDDAIRWFGPGYNQFTSRSNLSNDYDSQLLTNANVPKTMAQNCNCNMVPICHVKMLIESIEKKLQQSKCTCDSLNCNVCPIHSKMSLYKF